jgi:uncharacterized repeat protein (TIGR03803 family)
VQSNIGLVADAAGDLYGTTASGGANGDGSVFELAKGSSTLTTLYSFNLADPSLSNLVIDSAGNLYGSIGGLGEAFVFELPKGSNQIITLLPGVGTPCLAIDAAGNLYGANGDIFELPQGSSSITTLASFRTGVSIAPTDLVIDPAGDIYRVTLVSVGSVLGTVIEVKAGSHVGTTLATFDDGTPVGLALDAAGDIYGLNSAGSVFELKQGTGNVITVASFTSQEGQPIIGQDGDSGLLADPAGDVFGLTGSIIFKVPAGGNAVETLATYSPPDPSTAGDEVQGLVLDSTGTLYLATFYGNGGNGAVFDPIPLTPSTTLPGSTGTTAVTVANLTDYSNGLVADSAGNLYGAYENAVFELVKGSNAVTTLASSTGTALCRPYAPAPALGDHGLPRRPPPCLWSFLAPGPSSVRPRPRAPGRSSNPRSRRRSTCRHPSRRPGAMHLGRDSYPGACRLRRGENPSLRPVRPLSPQASGVALLLQGSRPRPRRRPAQSRRMGPLQLRRRREPVRRGSLPGLCIH